jgi:hypothetical protein
MCRTADHEKEIGMSPEQVPSIDAVFAVVAERVLALHPEDQAGRMLHSPGLRTGGKFYGFAPHDGLIVKLPAARVTELIDRGLGEACSPRPGRPMREWVQIPAPDEQAALGYLLEARAFVAGTA